MAKKYDPLKSNRSSYCSGRPTRLSWSDTRSSASFGKPYKPKSYKINYNYKVPKTRTTKTSNSGQPGIIAKGFAYLILLPFFLFIFVGWLIYTIITKIISYIKAK